MRGIVGGFLCILCSGNLYAQTTCHFFSNKQQAGTLQVANPASVGVNAAKLALVDAQINQDIANGFPGMALLVIKDAKVIKQSVYGYKLKYDRQTTKPLKIKEPLSCQTLFDLASNTKIYATTYALMHLVYESKIDLDKPVHFYLPKYAGCDSNGQCRKTRTIRDLLTHSAGYTPSYSFFKPNKLNNFYSQNRLLTESIILQQFPFKTPRALNSNYSDIDFILLGMLIEKVSGIPLDKYVAQTIYQPLGLQNTTFSPLKHGFTFDDCAATEIDGKTRGGTVDFPHIRDKVIQCQVHDEVAFYSLGEVSGHAGLFSNLEDLAVLTQSMLNNGSYKGVHLWNSTIESQFTQATARFPSYALGWRKTGLNHEFKVFGDYASSEAYGHTGWTGTMILIDPKYQLIIILLTNKRHSPYVAGKFASDKFASAKYYPLINLIYQALDTRLVK